MIKIEITSEMKKLHKEYYKNNVYPNFEASQDMLGLKGDGTIDSKVDKNVKDKHTRLMKYCEKNWEVLAVGTPDDLKEFYEQGEKDNVFELLKSKEEYVYNKHKKELSYVDIIQHIFGYKEFITSKSLYKKVIDSAKIELGKKRITATVKQRACEIIRENLEITLPQSIIEPWNENEIMEYINDAFTKVITLQNYKDYKLFREGWDAYSFVFMSGLRVCPYCNRQYITPIISTKGKARADLDHFFPKSKYPYFSMSLYNLIPCCKVCNSSLKGTKEFTFDDIHPYRESVDDYMYFSADLSNTTLPYPISLKSRKKEHEDKCKQYKEILKIETLYNYHQNVVKDLLLKRRTYTEEYIDELYERYKDYFSSKEEIKQMIIGYIGDKKSINEEPLTKFKIDIVEQLGFDKVKIDKEVIDALEKMVNTR